MQGIKEEVPMQNLISNDQQNRNSPPAKTMGFNYLGGENVGSNNGSPTATGEENSLRAGTTAEENSLRPGATGEEKYRRIRLIENEGSPPGTTEEENSLRPGAPGEEKYRRGYRPGATGEENSLRVGAKREEKSLRVHMFDKVVTPSDVGKLNRLVIPKHHAQKCFPLGTREKERGLLLTFEDNMGKEWMFRYSYWSSSQSYVFTKGWNRFVREMDLHAGDIVSFHRAADGRNMEQHFYISWRRCSFKAPLLCSTVRRGQTQQHLCYRPYLISSLAALQYNGGAAMSCSPNSGGAAVTANWRVEETNGLASAVTGHFIAGGLGQNCGGERNAPFRQLNPGERPTGVVSCPAQNTAAAGSGKRVRLFGVTL